MDETPATKKQKKKKKDKRSKLLLGCIDVPSSNEESFDQPSEGSRPVIDEKKEAKRLKKLAKIAKRNEKKEKKKREKIQQKVGSRVENEGSAMDGGSAVRSIEKKERKKKKKNGSKEENNSTAGATVADEVEGGRVTSIGDDSVVVVELSLDEEGAAVVGRKRKLEGILPKRKKKKIKLAECNAETPTADESTKDRKKKSKKSKTAQDVQSAECLSQTPGPNPHDASINSTNVSSLLSPAVGAGGAVTVERKLEQCDTNAIKPGMTSVDDIKGPLTSYCAKDMVVAPVPPARSNKKKKKKVASEMNAATRSDSETPITGLKSDVIAELKEKVKKKKRKSDHVCTDNDVTPVSNEMSTTETMKHGDGVFATPTKNQTPVAKPSLGQWGKVELGSTEKTQKFFRLLGGMKKQTGSPLSFRSSKGSASSADGREDPEKAIMAMGRKDADVLNNKLEEQFKKALGGINKGKVGLGFSPQLDPSTKNFHIDVNSSKSVKF